MDTGLHLCVDPVNPLVDQALNPETIEYGSDRPQAWHCGSWSVQNCQADNYRLILLVSFLEGRLFFELRCVQRHYHC